MPGEENDDKSDSENSISSLVTSSSDRSHGERADLRKKKLFLKVNQIIRGWGSYKAHVLFKSFFYSEEGEEKCKTDKVRDIFVSFNW